ncbi:hypothetical protein [Oryza sativa Japonica Group]|uniref:Late embryogenesis abundant protein LEA-2 subgroup domain-containing protein n=2 Tax=Oryza sativa subsp. japonica TaxID=39947 RepID=Q9ASC8_ORYSJ|nr:hypothetical protein [Oryza sativa Japonica Group]BAB89113.1 hypothetical protein [Oryza sativa Japonica Group]
MGKPRPNTTATLIQSRGTAGTKTAGIYYAHTRIHQRKTPSRTYSRYVRFETMELHPPSSCDDDAGSCQKTSVACNRQRHKILIVNLLYELMFFAFMFLCLYHALYDFPSEFSVQITAIHGLDRGLVWHRGPSFTRKLRVKHARPGSPAHKAHNPPEKKAFRHVRFETMEPHPPSSCDDNAGACQKASETCNRQRRKIFVVNLLYEFTNFIFIFLCLYHALYDFPSEFSVQITAIRGLDDAAPASPTIISPAIDVTLHVNNRRGTARCYRGGEAVVSYEGFTVASGTVPGFCAQGKRAPEVPFLASADGVGLPQRLCGRMALERRIGAMQLEVEVKLFGRDGGTAPRPTWMSCGLRMDEAQLPNTAHCSVLALQNWFSQPLFG